MTLMLSLAAVVATWASPQGYGTPGSSGVSGGGGGGDVFAPAQYNFQWDVNDSPSNNFYGHQEQRDGDNTQGSYYVQLPDTRTLRVDYTADQTGYHPILIFEGEAQFPSGPSSSGAAGPSGGTPSKSYGQPGK
ncbi:Pro-resilin-like 146 [Homarus americanus]|uniref:Pro-resilin-like 146 n=2 Tax=Homarus americanus TaxID=6706 RepID=A0A8J5JEJ2_HOMAM|nr:Pro-resilin-like 146 [Homarus americanus]